MNEVRALFNNLILHKFRMLPRIYKRNEKVLKLFNDTVLDLSAADQENMETVDTKNKDELTTFLAKVANITRETRTNQNSSSSELRDPVQQGRQMLADLSKQPSGSLEKYLMATQSNVREREGNSPSKLSGFARMNNESTQSLLN